jgi:hypothetical protein
VFKKLKALLRVCDNQLIFGGVNIGDGYVHMQPKTGGVWRVLGGLRER